MLIKQAYIYFQYSEVIQSSHTVFMQGHSSLEKKDSMYIYGPFMIASGLCNPNEKCWYYSLKYYVQNLRPNINILLLHNRSNNDV